MVKSGVDERWGEILRRLEKEPEDRWLERWRSVLEASRGTPILELDCGGGHDARFLAELGFAVIATEFSEEALELTRLRAPEARLEDVDLTRGLPFPDEVILASLSLHYFPWHKTLQIVGDIRRCLKPGGHLLARFNSTRDGRGARNPQVRRREDGVGSRGQRSWRLIAKPERSGNLTG